jgi:K+-transporting ATPase c subunit
MGLASSRCGNWCRHTDQQSLGFLGEPGISVVALNVALAEATG